MRNLRIGTVALTVVGSLGLYLSASAENPSTPGSTLQLTAKEVDATHLDLGPPGFSAGDRTVQAEDLFAAGRDTPVGSLGAECVIVRVHSQDAPSVATDERTGDALCTTSLQLPEGQLVLGGLVDLAEVAAGRPFSQAVLGGTGAFVNSRGHAVITPAPKTDRITVILD